MKKSIDTKIPTVDLDGPCYDCRWDCNENCAASLDTFDEIFLKVGGDSISVKYNCIEYSTVDTIHTVVRDIVEDIVIEKTPYLDSPIGHEPNDLDGYHTNYVRKREYKSLPNEDGVGGFSWYTEDTHVDPAGPAVSDGGSVPSQDWAKRRMFGDGSFYLESRQIVGYVDSYVIYFMCADDVNIEEADSLGSYDDPGTGGLVDYSKFITANKEDFFDSLPYDARLNIPCADPSAFGCYKDCSYTRQRLRKNLRVVSVKPTSNLLASERGLYPQGTAHGRYFVDNFRKGFDENTDADDITTEVEPDTAHFKVEEETCSMVVVKITSPVVLGTLHECMTAGGDKYVVLETDIFSCTYFDPATDECKAYHLGETLQVDEWSETLGCHGVHYDSALHQTHVTHTLTDKTWKYKGFKGKTMDVVVQALQSEFKNNMANKHIISSSTMFGNDFSDATGLDNRISGVIQSRFIPARHDLKDIKREYFYYVEEAAGAFTFSGSRWLDKFNINYKDVSRDIEWSEIFGSEYISACCLPGSACPDPWNLACWAPETSIGSGFLPKSTQLQLFLTDLSEIINLEVHHVAFKPSEIAGAAAKTLTLTKKYSTDWNIYSAACNILIPTGDLASADFSASSSQEEAFMSWNSFSKPFLSDNEGDLRNAMSMDAGISASIFCSNQSEYWNKCEKKSHTTKTPVGGRTWSADKERWISYCDSVEVATSDSWESLAYSGSIAVGQGATRVDKRCEVTVSDGPTVTTSGHNHGVSIHDAELTALGACPSGPYGIAAQSNFYWLPIFDTQRVQGSFILDYQHLAFRNYEIPPGYDWNNLFDENLGEECYLNDDDLRYIQLRKKKGNYYGVKSVALSCDSFDGTTKWPNEPCTYTGGVCASCLSYMTSYDGTARVYSFTPHVGECEYLHPTRYGGGGYWLWGFMPNGPQNGTCACPGDLNTVDDILVPTYDFGYKWWRYFLSQCSVGVGSDWDIPSPCDTKVPYSQPELNCFTSVMEGVADHPVHSGGTDTAPLCGIVQYDSANIVKLQPVFAQSLPLSQGGVPSAGNLEIILNKT
jgi:transposase-like protein